MSHTYAAKLDDEHARFDLEHELLSVLKSRDLEPEITEKWISGTIKPGDDDSAHVVVVVEHLTDPLEDVDVVEAERNETHICSCKGFYHHYYDQDVGAKVGDCRHVERVKQERRLNIPPEQQTLEP